MEKGGKKSKQVRLDNLSTITLKFLPLFFVIYIAEVNDVLINMFVITDHCNSTFGRDFESNR